MASIPSFIFGAGTKYKTQEELERAREQVKEMLGDIGQSGYTGWGGVMADLGKGIGARIEKGRIGEGQEFLTGEQSKLWDMFGGGGGYGGGTVAGDAGADALVGNGSLDSYFASIRGAESGGNDNAKNPKSSASGRYQFTRGTWDNMIRTHPELGLTRDGMFDPGQQERAIRAFTADNANVLQAAGIPISGGTLYGAHFLGAGGARQAFRSPDNARMSDVVGPGVVRANPFLANMTVGDFKRWTAKKGGGASIDLSRSGGDDALAGAGGNDAAAGGGKNDVAVAGVDPVVTGSTSGGPSLLQARPVPINQAGLRTPQGQEFLGRMTNPAPMGGGPQPPPMIPGMNGPMPPPPQVTPASVPIPPVRPAPVPPPQPAPALVPSTAPGRLSDEYVQPNAAAPTPAPTPARPPIPTPRVDPFTDMILGDKAAQFRPGNFSQPLPPGVAAGGLQAARQALRGPGGAIAGGGGANVLAGGAGTQFPAAPPAPGTPAAAGFGVPRAGGGGGGFPPAPAPPQAQAGGGGKIAKLQFILASPYASKEQKLMAASMIEREYALEDERRKAASPEAQLEMEYKRALIEKAKAEAGGSGGPDFDDTSGVRKEITNLKAYENLSQASSIWNGVRGAADRKTTQADLAIILGIAKIMDPTSIVQSKEGEAVRDTGGATTELANWFSYLKSNSDAVLDDAIRERLLAEGYGRVKAYEDEYTRATDFYRQFADRNRIDPKDIIQEFPAALPWKPGGDAPIDPNDPLGIRTRKGK